jgi:hypothetical protein
VGTSSGTANPSPRDTSAREQSTDPLLGVSAGSRASGGGRRGSGSRASDAENRTDAGDAEEGDVDAGEADAGDVDTDAGLLGIDGGVVDAGVAPL